jgi:hypothetical protein
MLGAVAFVPIGLLAFMGGTKLLDAANQRRARRRPRRRRLATS